MAAAMLVSIGYRLPSAIAICFFPPDVPERCESLDHDPTTGVAYPTKKAKQPAWTMKEARYSQFFYLIAVYTTGVFASTWWI